MITILIRYTGEEGAAQAFAKEMTESGVVDRIRAEEGNVGYEYFLPLEDTSKTVMLLDRWKDQEALDIHHDSPMMGEIMALREKYDLHMQVERIVGNEEDLSAHDSSFLRK